MSKRFKIPNSERGITLIALIVMIIIIIILSVVVIGKIGDHGLIDTTIDVAENYEVVAYKGQIEEVVHKTIIGYSAKGEVPTLQDMADALNDEEWVMSAIANTDATVTNPDIIVTVDRGYVFQVFYNSTYGKVMVDYIGSVPEGENPETVAKSLPTLKARYEGAIGKIIAEAADKLNRNSKARIYI